MDMLYFTFNGISSEQYNMVIQNEGEDLVFPSQPSFDTKVAAPMYQGTNYRLGTDIKSRTFSFNCWIDSITREEVDGLLTWLDVESTGKLILNYNPDFYYSVYIKNISDFKHFLHREDGNTVYHNFEFSITFETIKDSAALSDNIYSTFNEEDQGLFYEIIYPWEQFNGNDDPVVCFYNWGTEKTYMNIFIEEVPFDNGYGFDPIYEDYYNMLFGISIFPDSYSFLEDEFYIDILEEYGHHVFNYARPPYHIDTRFGFVFDRNRVFAEALSEINVNRGPIVLPAPKQTQISFEEGHYYLLEELDPITRFKFFNNDKIYSFEDFDNIIEEENQDFLFKTFVVQYVEPVCIMTKLVYSDYYEYEEYDTLEYVEFTSQYRSKY